MYMILQSWKLALAAAIVVSSIGSGRQTVSRPAAGTSIDHVMTAQELAALPSGPPDQRIVYGPDPSQYGELRVPAGTAPHPLVVLIHGGCFKAAYASAQNFGAMADALGRKGLRRGTSNTVVSANLEVAGLERTST